LHRKNIPLIVDEAHGAHLGMHSDFLPSALSLGADIVIQSVHKTLPSLTQTALLHFKSNIISKHKLEEYLSIYQSSSPSYILMASIERCINLLIENGETLFEDYVEMIKDFRRRAKTFRNIKIIDGENMDISKLVISVINTNYDGNQLYYDLLNEFHLQMEMKSEDYVIAMTTFCDTQDGFERLFNALHKIDKKLEVKSNHKKVQSCGNFVKQYCTSAQAFDKPTEMVFVEESLGRVSGEYKFMYPPGIPIIVPGEIINEEIIDQLDKVEKIAVLKGEV